MMKRTLKHRATALFLMIATLLTVVYPSYAVEVTSQGTNQSHITDQNDTIYTSEGTEPYFRYEPDVMAQQYVEDSRIPARSGKILDYVNADEFKTAGHTIRLEEFEELNTYVFQNSDGTRSVYIMDENVKYVDKDGAVKEKDLTLLKKGNGYGITQSDIELFLPDNPAQGIDLGFSGYEIKLTPKTQNLSKVKTTAEKRDNSVVYTDYFGKDISLVYTPLLSGVKEDIVLYSYKENQSYKFDLETDGLKVYSDRNGYYLAENAKSECIFRLGEIILYDDVGKPGTGNMTVETVTEGEKYLLTVTADEAFLTDETTVYPVTIDPGILVSDNDTGTNSIVDCPIFEGFPNSSFGAYTYNRVGTPSGSYGVGRTAVKLDGLVSSTEFSTINASQITNVTFWVRASGGDPVFVNVYPITGNTNWTETTLTWNNIGSYSTAVNYGGTLGKNTTNGFNITELAKAWKNGTYSPSAGFIMISTDETSNKSFCSSEFSDTTKRPYVVMTYDPEIEIDHSSVSLLEGDSITLTATTRPAGETVEWISYNTTVATVDQNGVVTAHKAGSAQIAAFFEDSDGNFHTAACIVYACIEDGLYYLENWWNGYTIEFEGSYSYGENEVLTVWDGGDEVPTDLYRMFKITYIGNGVYSIRSMLDSRMGWSNAGTTVNSVTIGTSDNSVSSNARWWITYDLGGYVIRSYANNNKAVTCPDDPDENWDLLLSNFSWGNAKQNWDFNKILTEYNGVIVDSSTDELVIGDSFRFKARIYSSIPGVNGNGVQWSVANTIGSATIVSSTGLLTGVASGRVTVTVSYIFSPEIVKNQVLTVQIIPIRNGMYFLRNRQTAYYTDFNESTMASGSTVYQYEYVGDDSQKWIFTHVGDGYYTIRSKKTISQNYYLGVKSNSTALDADVVLRTDSITNGMKWKIQVTDNNAYKIIPKTGESNDYVLATSTSNQTNGAKLIQGDYIGNNNSYRDEWYIGDKRIFIATVNLFYDKGYYVYYNETENEGKMFINSCLKNVSERYNELLGLIISTNGATYYNSTIDICKGTVTSSNINNECLSASGSHSNCTVLFDTIRNHFESSFPGNEKTTSVYWTCHFVRTEIGIDETNRSYSSGEQVYLLERSTNSKRTLNSQGVLMHELNHQYGAPDHYHEKITDDVCRGGDICSECGSNPRPESCIMNRSRQDITQSTIICSECINDIINHLKQHH